MKRVGLLLSVVIACAIATTAAFAYAFTSPEGNFTADFPAVPAMTKSKGKTNDGIAFDQYNWSVSTTHNYWAVAMIVYSGHASYNYDNGVKGVLAAVKGKLRTQKEIDQGGIKGREVIVDLPQSHIALRQRFLWTGDRLYEIVYTSDSSDGTGADLDAFFNSFHLVK